MTVEELFIALGFKVDNSSKAKAQSEANALKGTMTKILGAIGIGFTVTGIKNFIQETASYAAEMKATNTQFEQTFEDMAEAAEESLKKVSQKTGIAETRMKAAYSRMASFAKTGGMDAAEANDFTARSMEALADNAAYMDKTIEETQETFQKLLKGNFQLDDNLNFNLSEAERNEMAMSMFQKKTYNDLTENEKKELILQKLINANKQMGAKGQASREAGEYTNQVGELADVIKQLKATVGAIFLPQVLTFTQKMASFLSKLADKLGDAEEEGTLAYKITQKITKAMDRFFSICSKLYGMGKKVIQMLGGFENAMKVLGITAGAVMTVLAVNKIKEFAKTFDLATLKIWAAVFGMIALGLAIDDFVGFMNGKESVTGHLLDYLGIDQDEAREQISSIGDTLSSYFESAVDTVKDLADAIGDAVEGISEFFGYQDSASMFKDVVVAIAEAFKTIGGVALIAAGVLEQFTGNDRFSDFTTVNTRNHGYVRMSKDDAEEYQEKSLTPSAESQERAAEIEDYWASKNYSDTSQADGLFEKGISMIFGSWNRIFGTNFGTTTDETITSYSQYDDDVFEEAKKQIEDSANTASNAADTTVKNSEKSTTGIYAMADAGQSAFDKMRYMVDQGTSAFSSLSLLPDILTSSINKNAVIYQNNSITNNVSSTGDAAKLTTKQQKSANLGLETAVAGD